MESPSERHQVVRWNGRRGLDGQRKFLRTRIAPPGLRHPETLNRQARAPTEVGGAMGKRPGPVGTPGNRCAIPSQGKPPASKGLRPLEPRYDFNVLQFLAWATREKHFPAVPSAHWRLCSQEQRPSRTARNTTMRNCLDAYAQPAVVALHFEDSSGWCAPVIPCS